MERTIKQKENDNEQLLKELEDLNVSVHERRHIEQVNGKQFSRIVVKGAVRQWLSAGIALHREEKRT